MYRVEVNGVQLAVEEQGSGEPIVFVPGSLSDYRSWSAQVEFFSPRYHAISYSRRYQYPHQLSDSGDSRVSANAADLAALIDRLGVAPVHLVGHSFGAFTALVCARDHPELVRTLVLGEPPALSLLVKDPANPATIFPLFVRSPHTALALMKFGIKAAGPAQQAFARRDAAAAVQSFVRGITGRQIVIDELPSIVREQMRANANALQPEMNIAETFTCEEARVITAPTLLVRGSDSPRFFGTIVDRLARCLPNAQQLVLPGASHFLHWDKPNEFNAGLSEFLASHSAGASTGTLAARYGTLQMNGHG